jgi:hypothetical protein
MVYDAGETEVYLDDGQGNVKTVPRKEFIEKRKAERIAEGAEGTHEIEGGVETNATWGAEEDAAERAEFLNAQYPLYVWRTNRTENGRYSVVGVFGEQ